MKYQNLMDRLKKRPHYLDSLGLFIIGITSLGYIIFVRDFAEKHIQLPFLNFPIFVGEIVLFICLFLFWAKYKDNWPELTKWHYLILGYFAFVVLKAVWGYIFWGPLALRHAALLYYPVFAVFGYVFYCKDLLNKKTCLILFFTILAIFGLIFLGMRPSEYWSLTLVFLGFILIKFYPKNTIKFVMVLILLAMIPYKDLFQSSRMMILSNFVSGVYLAAILPAILNVDKKLKGALALLIVGVFILGLYKLADHGAVKSIVAFNKMAEVIKVCDAYIEANDDHFVMEERKEVKLYNPAKPSAGALGMGINIDKNAAEKKRAKEELKKIIIKDVKEKMEGFSLGQLDKKEQKEVKQEIVSIIDMQLLKDAQSRKTSAGTSAPIIPAAQVQTPRIKIENKPKENKPEEDSAIIRETPPIIPAAQVETPRITIEDKPQENKAEENSAIIRETLLEQVKQEIRTASVDIPNNEKQYAALVAEVKKEMEMDLTEQEKKTTPLPPQSKTGWAENNNAVFRLLIWRDMWRDLYREKPVLGFSFGRPLRSKSLEMLHWGDGDWARDGWIEPHNSYWHIIYRAGIVGILFIFSFLFILFKMIRYFILVKSFTGILLCGIIINWFVAANFLLIFELPYTAIPIWTIYGMTFAYYYKMQERNRGAKENYELE